MLRSVDIFPLLFGRSLRFASPLAFLGRASFARYAYLKCFRGKGGVRRGSLVPRAERKKEEEEEGVAMGVSG